MTRRRWLYEINLDDERVLVTVDSPHDPPVRPGRKGVNLIGGAKARTERLRSTWQVTAFTGQGPRTRIVTTRAAADRDTLDAVLGGVLLDAVRTLSPELRPVTDMSIEEIYS